MDYKLRVLKHNIINNIQHMERLIIQDEDLKLFLDEIDIEFTSEIVEHMLFTPEQTRLAHAAYINLMKIAPAFTKLMYLKQLRCI